MNPLRRAGGAILRHLNERLDVETIEVRLSMLPQALDGYRLVIISDMHIVELGPYEKKIFAAIQEIAPDCILIAGDTIDEYTAAIDALTPFFYSLSHIAPTIAILGNNDCLPSRIETLRNMYRRSGVTLLENETRLLDARGYPLQITGLIDPTAERMGIQPAHIMQPPESANYVPLSGALPPQAEKKEGYALPSILMLHQPQLAGMYAAMHPSIIVAGHAHGGQFRLPLVGSIYAPNQGFFPRLTSGLYPVGDSQLIVSRGLGNHHFPFRLGNRPHLPVVILRRI